MNLLLYLLTCLTALAQFPEEKKQGKM